MAENLVTYCVVHQPRRIKLPAQVIPPGTKPGAMAAYLIGLGACLAINAVTLWAMRRRL